MQRLELANTALHIPPSINMLFFPPEPKCIYILKSLESDTALTAVAEQTPDVEVPITTITATLSCQRCPLRTM